MSLSAYLDLDASLQTIGLCVVAAVAGAINSVAGGGTLLTFPALIAALGGTAEAAVLANATSTVALFPGSLAGMAGYRRELLAARSWIKLLLLPSTVGGLIGSLLLMLLPAESFKLLVPWLLLTAAVLFWLQPHVARRIVHDASANTDGPQHVLLVATLQLFVAIYGGYFGAGIGILMLAALGLMGLHDIHQMNGLKTLFGSAINGVAVVVFIASGKVQWPFAAAMAAAAIAGGYGGAHVARRLDRNFVRRVVIFIGLALATYYLYQQWQTSR
ncbi:MAG TPA: sulfite exporter TauE/SafE family protein [Pirellulales bacterium]|nr:sulfite exporter TauE/SafE family protein [Pirellulales bacterium]